MRRIDPYPCWRPRIGARQRKKLAVENASMFARGFRPIDALPLDGRIGRYTGFSVHEPAPPPQNRWRMKKNRTKQEVAR